MLCASCCFLQTSQSQQKAARCTKHLREAARSAKREASANDKASPRERTQAVEGQGSRPPHVISLSRPALLCVQGSRPAQLHGKKLPQTREKGSLLKFAQTAAPKLSQIGLFLRKAPPKLSHQAQKEPYLGELWGSCLGLGQLWVTQSFLGQLFSGQLRGQLRSPCKTSLKRQKNNFQPFHLKRLRAETSRGPAAAAAAAGPAGPAMEQFIGAMEQFIGYGAVYFPWSTDINQLSTSCHGPRKAGSHGVAL